MKNINVMKKYFTVSSVLFKYLENEKKIKNNETKIGAYGICYVLLFGSTKKK